MSKASRVFASPRCATSVNDPCCALAFIAQLPRIEAWPSIADVYCIIATSWSRATSLPFNRPRRLRRVIVDHAVDPPHLVDDARRDAAQELGVEREDIGGHAVDAGHGAQAADVI